LGEEIRFRRWDRGFTQQQLAERIGISASYLCEIERGAKSPSVKVVKRLADELHLPVTALVKGQVEPLAFGERLKSERQKRGLGRAELALAAGLTENQIDSYEAGRSQPGGRELRHLAAALELPATELFCCLENKLGTKVASLRQAGGLTQRELALRAAISPAMVSKLELGELRPSLKTIEKLAAALGVSSGYLLAEEDDEDDFLENLSPEIKSLLRDEKVRLVLERVSGLNERELQFVLQMISELKRSQVGIG